MDKSSPETTPTVPGILAREQRRDDLWGLVGSLAVLAALPWVISGMVSYFMLAWRTIP